MNLPFCLSSPLSTSPSPTSFPPHYPSSVTLFLHLDRTVPKCRVAVKTKILLVFKMVETQSFFSMKLLTQA